MPEPERVPSHPLEALVAMLNAETAIANRELELGGWLSDHQSRMYELINEIELYNRNLGGPTQ